MPVLAGHDGILDLDTIAKAKAIARKALEPMDSFRKVEKLAFVGGSATTTASVVYGKKTKFERILLSRTDLQRTLVRLAGMSNKERRNVIGMKPHRADILPAGIIVLETALEMLGHETAVATTADLLVGYLLQQRDRQPTHAYAIPH
jgi:exopolyphosphatase/guanosine-5'-triphosphate,3'-diphosphate pyrophosphatase